MKSVNLNREPECEGAVDVCGVCNGPGEQTWYQDLDGDELENPAISTESCTQPDGFILNNLDPDDTRTPKNWNYMKPMNVKKTH